MKFKQNFSGETFFFCLKMRQQGGWLRYQVIKKNFILKKKVSFSFKN